MLLATFDPFCVAPSPGEGRNYIMSTSEGLLDLAQSFFDDQPCLGPSYRPLRIAGGLPYSRSVFRGRPCKHQCPDESTDEEDEMGNLCWPFQRHFHERAARRESDSATRSSNPRKKSKREGCSCPNPTAANSTNSCTAADKAPCGNSSSPADPAASAAEENTRSSAVCPSRVSTPWTLRVPLGSTPDPQDLRVWTRDGVLTVMAHTRGGEGGRATFLRHVASLPSHVAPEALTSRLSRDGVLTVTCTRVLDGSCDVPVTTESREHQEQEDGTRSGQEGTASRVQPGDGETRVGLGSQSTGDDIGIQAVETATEATPAAAAPEVEAASEASTEADMEKIDAKEAETETTESDEAKDAKKPGFFKRIFSFFSKK